jgi:hypothetical protein
MHPSERQRLTHREFDRCGPCLPLSMPLRRGEATGCVLSLLERPSGQSALSRSATSLTAVPERRSSTTVVADERPRDDATHQVTCQSVAKIRKSGRIIPAGCKYLTQHIEVLKIRWKTILKL